MRPYGISLKREFCYDLPDSVDGTYYAMKSSKVRLRDKGGDYKSSVRNSAKKRHTRISWKRKARIESRNNCRSELATLQD